MNVHMGDLVQSIGNVMDFYPNLKGLIDVKCRDSIQNQAPGKSTDCQFDIVCLGFLDKEVQFNKF